MRKVTSHKGCPTAPRDGSLEMLPYQHTCPVLGRTLCNLLESYRDPLCKSFYPGAFCPAIAPCCPRPLAHSPCAQGGQGACAPQ